MVSEQDLNFDDYKYARGMKAPPRISAGLKTVKNIEQDPIVDKRKNLSRTHFGSNFG